MIIFFIVITAVETLVLAGVVHVVYRAVAGWWKYRRMGAPELVIIAGVTFPGVAGCARGWAGFGVPLPLIPGMPLDMVIDSKDCGWVPILLHGDWILVTITWAAILGFLAWLMSEKRIRRQHEAYLASVPSSTKHQMPSPEGELIDAVIGKDIASVRRLLESGANPRQKNATGYSAMDYARGHGVQMILELLEQYDSVSSNFDSTSNAPPGRPGR